MSIAIHEITHFNSLRNSVGRVLTMLGQLAAFQAEAIRDQLVVGESRADVDLDWFLFLRVRHELILRTWTPLLEGLAVYAQMAKPCRQLDELNPAVRSILSVAVTLAALDGREATGDESLNAITKGLMEAAYRCLEAGPSLIVDGRTFAAAIEFPNGPQWLPYFLGHAYVRAISDRLARRIDDLACPEKFIPFIMRFISSSGYRIQRGEPSPEDLRYIGNIYGWIETIDSAPEDRLHEAFNSSEELDLLHFLRTGKPETQNDVLSGARDRSMTVETMGNALSSELSATEPTAWRAFSRLAETMSAFSAEQESPGWNVREAEARIMSGTILGVESLNFSSGGTARLAGIRFHAFGANHAIGLCIADATWWIMLSDAELQNFPWAFRAIPSLPLTDDPLEGFVSPDIGILLTLDLYLSYVTMGVREGIAEIGEPMYGCLIQLSDNEHRALFKVDPAPPPHHRAVLRPVDMTSSTGVFLGSNILRDMSSGAVSADLKDWAAYLRRHGQAVASDKVLAAHHKQKLTASRIDQLLARKILSELLGHHLGLNQQSAVRTGGMRGVLPEKSGLLELLTASYSAPCVVGEYMGGSLSDDLAGINRISHASIGKPVFDLNIDGHTVRYLGLWG